MSERTDKIEQHVALSPLLEQRELAQEIVDTAAAELSKRADSLGNWALVLDQELAETNQTLAIIEDTLKPRKDKTEIRKAEEYPETDIYEIANTPGNVDEELARKLYNKASPFDITFDIKSEPQTFRRHLSLKPWLDDNKQRMENEFGQGFLALNITRANHVITNVLEVLDFNGNINDDDPLVANGVIADVKTEEDSCSFTITDPAMFYERMSKHKIVGPKSWVALLCVAGMQAKE